MNDYDDIIEEILLFLYKKHYDDEKKDMARLKIMHFLYQNFDTEEKAEKTMQIMSYYNEKMERCGINVKR